MLILGEVKVIRERTMNLVIKVKILEGGALDIFLSE